jgi:hypothetical protein
MHALAGWLLSCCRRLSHGKQKVTVILNLFGEPRFFIAAGGSLNSSLR